MSRFIEFAYDNSIYVISDSGKLWKWRRKLKSWRRIHGVPHVTSGHIMITLTSPNAPHLRTYLHRLVLERFVGPCPPGFEACHEDDNPANNRLNNLRWDTRSSNMADRAKYSGANRGESNGFSKLTDAIVRECRRLTGLGLSDAEVARRLGIRPANVKYVRKGGWKHVV